MQKARKKTLDSRQFRPLNPEEYRSITGGETSDEAGGGLLAFPFIQQAMQGIRWSGPDPEAGRQPHG